MEELIEYKDNDAETENILYLNFSSKLKKDISITSFINDIKTCFPINKKIPITLELSFNELNDEQLISIIKVMEEYNVATLYINRSLYLGRNNITTEGAKIIAEFLKSNSQLTILDLQYNDIEDITPIAEIIKKGCSLSSLIISGNIIKDEGLKILSDALNTEKTELYRLDVSSIGATNIRDLAALFTRKNSIKELNISHNYFGISGINNFCDFYGADLKKLNISSIVTRDTVSGYVDTTYAENIAKLIQDDDKRDGINHLDFAIYENIKISNDSIKIITDALDLTKFPNCSITSLNVSGHTSSMWLKAWKNNSNIKNIKGIPIITDSELKELKKEIKDIIVKTFKNIIRKYHLSNIILQYCSSEKIDSDIKKFKEQFDDQIKNINLIKFLFPCDFITKNKSILDYNALQIIEGYLDDHDIENFLEIIAESSGL